jgi:hypothetical protein
MPESRGVSCDHSKLPKRDNLTEAPEFRWNQRRFVLVVRETGNTHGGDGSVLVFFGIGNFSSSDVQPMFTGRATSTPENKKGDES